MTYNRICFTLSRVSKKSQVSCGIVSCRNRVLWNAVIRNRAKRLSREAYRLIRNRIASGYDLILLVYPETGLVLSDRMEQLESLFSKAGLLK